jgi:transposase InsO family protein
VRAPIAAWSGRSTPPARATAPSTGVRKTWKELKRRGVEVGRDRVARLMRQEGLEGVRRGKKRRTTIVDEAALERARDLLQRDFTATRPNEKWMADITYLRTWGGSCTSPSSSTVTAG